MPFLTDIEADLNKLADRIQGLRPEQILAQLDNRVPPIRPSALPTSPAAVALGAPIPIEGILWADGSYHARSVDDVQQLVRAARANRLRLRVAGSSHSITDAVYTSSARDLRVVLRDSLQQVEFISQSPGQAIVRVGAGCYLGVNPTDPESTLATSLNGILDSRGYALPTLGGISHQTVAGFLQTSSSGGSLRHGIADSVVGIELVDGTGGVQVFSQGDDRLNAAAVAMGLAGVVTHIRFEVRASYYVEGEETNFEMADSLLSKDNLGRYRLGNALTANEYLHLNWFPQRFVKRVTQWTGVAVAPTPGDVRPYHSALKGTWLNVLAAAVLEITGGILHLDPESIEAQRIVGALLSKFVPVPSTQQFRGIWYKTLPSDDEVKVDSLIKVIFTEIWLPLEQLEPALDRLNGLFAGNGAAAGNFIVELYGARRSPFWLSPSFERDVIRVDVFWWAYNIGDPLAYFGQYWDILLDLPGARLHWGKQLPPVGSVHGTARFNPDFLRRAYPRFDDWLAFRALIDPDKIFVSDYWARIFDL